MLASDWFSYLVFASVGALVGWVAGKKLNAPFGRLALYLLTGIVGGLAGGMAAAYFGLFSTGGLGGLFLSATVGAVVLVLLLYNGLRVR